MVGLLENIAKGVSYGIDTMHAANAINHFYEAEKYRAQGDLKKYQEHRKEVKKYYKLIVNQDSKKIRRRNNRIISATKKEKTSIIFFCFTQVLTFGINRIFCVFYMTIFIKSNIYNHN